MRSHDTRYRITGGSLIKDDEHRERRLELLVRRLPARLQKIVRWLRQPPSRWARLPAGLLLTAGGFLSILPIFGLWMLPLGLVLLSDDVKFLRVMTGRVLEWVEHHRPHWMGLARTTHHSASSTKGTS